MISKQKTKSFADFVYTAGIFGGLFLREGFDPEGLDVLAIVTDSLITDPSLRGTIQLIIGLAGILGFILPFILAYKNKGKIGLIIFIIAFIGGIFYKELGTLFWILLIGTIFISDLIDGRT